MSTINLTEKKLAIRKWLVKVASEDKIISYSDLVKEGYLSIVHSIERLLERITQYHIENKQLILISIVVLKSTGLPSEGFFELCYTLNIKARLNDLQQECFEYVKS